MEFTTILFNPYVIILILVMGFMAGLLFANYKKSGNDERFRILILNSIDSFMTLYDASKLGKEEFIEKLTAYVKMEIFNSNLLDSEKDTLLNGKLVDRMVTVFVNSIFEATEKAKEKI